MPTPLADVPPPLAVALFAALGPLEGADVEPAVPEDDDPPPQAARTTAPAARKNAGTRLHIGSACYIDSAWLMQRPVRLIACGVLLQQADTFPIFTLPRKRVLPGRIWAKFWVQPGSGSATMHRRVEAVS